MFLDCLRGMLTDTQVSEVHPKALQSVLLDLPGLLFFTTYTLLVLFWAEIYHQVTFPSLSISLMAKFPS